MMALPVFYLFHEANTSGDQAYAIEGYPGVFLKHAIKFSSVGTVSLACREAFDHAANGLTGANFAKSSDEALEKVAQYWSTKSTRSFQESTYSPRPTQVDFPGLHKSKHGAIQCPGSARAPNWTAKATCWPIGRHLSLENYEFSTLDCAHVVASLTLIGEIIRSFDNPSAQPTYYDTLDEASLIAARKLFLATPDIRLFQHIKVEMQSRLCWQWGTERGRRMLLEQLPYAIGWFWRGKQHDLATSMTASGANSDEGYANRRIDAQPCLAPDASPAALRLLVPRRWRQSLDVRA
jgi:hypothetical protein